MSSKPLLDVGEKFNRLQVIRFVGRDKWYKALYECKCDCGNITVLSHRELVKGIVKSCGCIRREDLIKRSSTHGLSKTRIYRIYKSIVRRCYNSTAKSYEYYGKRGIYLCEEWYTPGVPGNPGFVNFYNWSMANGYSDNLSIDRKENDGPYAPWNCRWTDTYIQANNKRNNRHIIYNGDIYTFAQFSKYLGVSYNLLYMAIYENDYKSINRFIFIKLHPSITLHRKGGYYRDDNGFIILIPKYEFTII